MSVPEAPNDGMLIAAVLAGDREKFAELVRRYQRPLLRVAYSRLGRSEWAEDVVQEVFLALMCELGRYDASRAALPTRSTRSPSMSSRSGVPQGK